MTLSNPEDAYIDCVHGVRVDKACAKCQAEDPRKPLAIQVEADGYHFPNGRFVTFAQMARMRFSAEAIEAAAEG